jgi:hypothetical protein
MTQVTGNISGAAVASGKPGGGGRGLPRKRWGGGDFCKVENRIKRAFHTG